MIRTTSFATNTSTQVLLVDASKSSANNPKTVFVQNRDATNAVVLGGVNRGGPGVDLIGGAAYTLTTANGHPPIAATSLTLTITEDQPAK